MQQGSQGQEARRFEDRRQFLRRAGVAGAVAWTAPVILSKPALAQGTPQCVTMVWPTEFGAGSVSSGDSATLGGTTLTFTYADPTSAVAISTVDSTYPRGGSDTYRMRLNTSGSGPVTITLGFSQPVSSLAFDVLDVDQEGSGTAWRDQIDIAAWNGVASLAPTTDWTGTPQGASVSEVTTDLTFRGVAAESNATTGADVAFAFSAATDQVQITFSRGSTSTNRQLGIGIGSISWCA